jgi:hypothetical protein
MNLLNILDIAFSPTLILVSVIIWCAKDFHNIQVQVVLIFKAFIGNVYQVNKDSIASLSLFSSLTMLNKKIMKTRSICMNLSFLNVLEAMLVEMNNFYSVAFGVFRKAVDNRISFLEKPIKLRIA